MVPHFYKRDYDLNDSYSSQAVKVLWYITHFLFVDYLHFGISFLFFMFEIYFYDSLLHALCR